MRLELQCIFPPLSNANVYLIITCTQSMLQIMRNIKNHNFSKISQECQYSCPHHYLPLQVCPRSPPSMRRAPDDRRPGPPPRLWPRALPPLRRRPPPEASRPTPDRATAKQSTTGGKASGGDIFFSEIILSLIKTAIIIDGFYFYQSLLSPFPSLTIFLIMHPAYFLHPP